MNRNYEGKVRYTTEIGHDTERGCDRLELHWHYEEQDCIVAAIFEPYRDASWTLHTFDCDIPLELVEEMIAEAKTRLTKKSNPTH